MTSPAEIYDALLAEVQTVLVGNEHVVEGITISMLTGGHVLLEGIPGVGKTTIATLFARATGLESNRIQMTPDTLPADITGTQIYVEDTGEFNLKRGPIFTNVAVIDEINRATPKTQSALLESMQERAVTIDGETFPLPDSFIVIATQNPVEMEGVYELPQAQRDRFQFKLVVETPTEEQELAIIDRFDENPDLGQAQISQVVSSEDLFRARQVVKDVHVDRRVKRYIRDIVAGTRAGSDLKYGASPRAALSLLHASKAHAAIHGREYVIYDDIKALSRPILNHRVVLSAEAELNDRDPSDVVSEVVNNVELPEADPPTDTDKPLVSDGEGDINQD
jgi:MoxR-like ATPase